MGTTDEGIFKDQCSAWNTYMTTDAYEEFPQDDSGI